MKYLDYVSAMMVMDPKLVRVLMNMLENGEIEKLISEDIEKCRIFSISQLLALLRILVQASSNKVPQACDIILKRLQEECDRIRNCSINNEGKMSEADAKQIQQWHNIINVFLKDGIPSYKKTVLINFFLNFILAVGHLSDMSELAGQFSQNISTDLHRSVVFPVLCKDWSEYLKKIRLINEDLHNELLCRFKIHVDDISSDVCFDIFLNEGETISQEVSDILFDRAIFMFQEKKETGYFTRAVNFTRNLLGSVTNVQANSLKRLFSRCINDVDFRGRGDVFSIVKVSTDLPATSNMMKFFSKLKTMKLLDHQVIQKADLILDQTKQFMINLDEGNLTLEMCVKMLKDETRVTRLLILYECHHDNSNSGKAFDSKHFKTLIKIRLAEMDEYHKVAADVASFKSNFQKVIWRFIKLLC